MAKKKGNPWALCNWLKKHKRISPAKYEKCVKSIKKRMRKRK